MLLTILAVLTCILTTIYFVLTRKSNYWKKKGVPYLEPKIFVGNYGDFILMKKNLGMAVHDICQQLPNEPIIGAFYGTEPALIVKDPELLKIVTTKDFYYFSGRELSEHSQKEVLTKNLFNENGDKWKVVRQNLTPLFSSAKMKKMFYLIENCTKVFDRLLDEEVKTKQVQEARSLMARYTMDCIGSCVFGLETNVMGKDEKNNPFRSIADKIFESSVIRVSRILFRSIWPNIFYSLGLKAFSTDVPKFFNNVLLKVFEERKHKPGTRNDFVDLILSLKENNYITGDSLNNIKSNGATEKKTVRLEVDDELLLAQCIVFFAAGFETSATTLSYVLYEFAKNEEAQRRGHEEVDEYFRKHDGKLGYECVAELPYLEACIDETLRLYPVLTLLTREVIENYTLPSGVVLDKGLRVHIPVYHLHRHPDYFPEPDQFRPERFLPEEKHNIKPYTYFPFGEGPRICIGMRFAKMQMMAGLVTLLKNYRVELAEGMPRSVEYEPRSFVTASKCGINLKFIPRSITNKDI